jgi:starch synthase
MEKSISRMVAAINSKRPIDNFQICIQLKYILDKELDVIEYLKWFVTLNEVLVKYNISFVDIVSNLNFIKQNECLSNQLFSLSAKIMNLRNKEISQKASNLINSNLLGPIAFATPEIGRWSTVGGLGVMVDELSQGLVKLGQDVIMISPYYEKNRKGVSNYLKDDPCEFNYIGNITVNLDNSYTFGVHYGVVNNVKLYFLHNFDIFPSAYPDGNNVFTMKQISLFSKASLQLLCFIKIIPAVILTNDWFTGLVSAYSKHNHFGETFKGTTFFHIVHNLEPTYEGRIYTSPQEGSLDHIHKLPSYCVMDPYWKQRVVNPSRCAILNSDQWGTVSPSYRKDLMQFSPLNSLLNSHKSPFAFPNGIFKEQRLRNLTNKLGKDRNVSKIIIQKKYFKFESGDLSIPLFAFVGRITEQKGVKLILEATESIIQKFQGKINILVGGMGNPKDPYCVDCINRIRYLRDKYSYSFWADPNEFFTDGPLINHGSDFGLMPSVFEPGGIVQHEFFIASTPVLAFKTGGLKDTVIEYDYNNDKGNGILFESHNYNDFIYAVERAVNLFRNKEKLEIARINAFNSAIDVIDVATQWCKEFCRLRGKVFFNCSNLLNGVNNKVNSNDKNSNEIERLNKELEERLNKELESLLERQKNKEYLLSKEQVKKNY